MSKAMFPIASGFLARRANYGACVVLISSAMVKFRHYIVLTVHLSVFSSVLVWWGFCPAREQLRFLA